MGRSDGAVRMRTAAIVARHFGEAAGAAATERASSDGTYVALTYTVTASNRAQLDALYRELTACDEVLMAL
ncbi:MAG: DUF493 domain-containing protein [Gammaproteobacteria bacterium]|nr:DUF493 domain-containing protein [Gammaproteobacteria bacterium]